MVRRSGVGPLPFHNIQCYLARPATSFETARQICTFHSFYYFILVTKFQSDCHCCLLKTKLQSVEGENDFIVSKGLYCKKMVVLFTLPGALDGLVAGFVVVNALRLEQCYRFDWSSLKTMISLMEALPCGVFYGRWCVGVD